jgi:hypothetical protein
MLSSDCVITITINLIRPNNIKILLFGLKHNLIYDVVSYELFGMLVEPVGGEF